MKAREESMTVMSATIGLATNTVLTGRLNVTMRTWSVASVMGSADTTLDTMTTPAMAAKVAKRERGRARHAHRVLR